MTFREKLLKEVPLLDKETDYKEELKNCIGLYIIPTKKIHESGFNCMAFVVVYEDDNGKTKQVRIDVGSDVVFGCKDHSFAIDCDRGVLHLYDYGKHFSVDWIGDTFKIHSN